MKLSSRAILLIIQLLIFLNFLPVKALADPALINVGIYQNQPKIYLDEQGNPAGFFPEVLNEIANREGWELNYIPCSWNECLNMVENGELDLMPDVAFSQERLNRFNFNQEVVLGSWSIVYARQGNDIKSILDLDRKKVAVVKGSIQANKLKAEVLTYGIKPVFIETETFPAAFHLIEKGLADAGITNHFFGGQQRENFNLQETNVILYPSKIFFISTKQRARTLLDNIDRHLLSLKQDQASVYYRALHKTIAPTQKPTLSSLIFNDWELAWLAAHPTITVAINQAWPPMDFVDEQGVPRGIGVNIINALNTRVNGALKIVPLPWEEMYVGVKNIQIDALMDITPTTEREKDFHFTKPYLKVPHNIFALDDAPYYEDISKLSGKVVAAERGFFIVDVLGEKYPQIQVKEFNSTSEALDAVSKGDCDAYIGNRAVARHIIREELITNLKTHGKVRETVSMNAIGVRKDWSVLRDILQKALDDLSRTELENILSEWVETDSHIAAGLLQMTPVERAWIREHPVLKLGYDSDWPPIEYVDSQGQFVGMSADFIGLVESRLGIEIKPAKPQSWHAVINAIKSGQLDLISALTRTEQREKFLSFSEPYLTIPMVIVTRQETPYVDSIKTLAKEKIAVVDGYASHEKLKEQFPQIELLPTENVQKGLKQVIQGKAFAFIGSLATISHVLGREGMAGLKVSGETPFTYELAVGISNDQPILAGLIRKAVASISEQERNDINRRWISVTYESRINYSLLIKVVTGAILILGAIFYWNRRLSNEISLRKKVEKDLQASKIAAEAANHVKSAFLASMSHELRTPLNSIIGFNGLLLNELAGPLNFEQKKQLKMVKGSSQHLLNLINDVLDISKIEAGELELSLQEFSVQSLLSKIVETLQPLAEEKGLRLHVEIDPDIGTIVNDERRIQQVMINLVNNAVKFTEQGEIKVLCRRHNGFIEIRVIDTGIGIKEEDLGKLFKPFQQLDTGISRKYEGSGLGLSICKRILAMTNGQLHVESRYGKGSTFTILLPQGLEGTDAE